MKRSHVSALLLVIATIVTIGFVLKLQDTEPFSGQPDETNKPVADEQAADKSPSPFTVDEQDTVSAVFVTGDEPLQESQLSSGVADSASNENPPTLQELPSLVFPLSDEQFNDLVRLLNTNPALSPQLVDEFRQETDPERRRQLASILGEVGGEQALLLAGELIFSGDSESRILGLSILQEIQPGNAQARDLVSDMLATEVEPKVLIGALSALASPGDVDPPSRAYLSDQIAWLTSHHSDGVRSISLDVLSRWSNDGSYTDVLVGGLDDTSQYVRSSAAYALASHEDKSPAVIERLLNTLRDSTEPKRVKGAAIFALSAMPLTPAQTSELEALERELHTVRR